jgi:hypothetical protein
MEHKTVYYVGLHITSIRTIFHPSIRAISGPFTDRVIGPHHWRHRGGDHPTGHAVVIYEGGAIDPNVTESVELFELPFRDHLPRDETDLLRKIQTFTLEARCRDAKPCFAKFEYDPDKYPMIRLLKRSSSSI